MQSLYDKIVGLLDTGIIVLESHGRVVSWNKWMERRSGIRTNEIEGLSLLEVLPEIKNTRIARGIHKALNLNCPSVLSAKLLDASFPLYRDPITGTRRPERIVQSILIKPFQGENEDQYCVISIFDISSSNMREKALRTQSVTLTDVVLKLQKKDHELRALFQNTQNAILIFDQTGQVLNANPAAEKIFGLDTQKICQRKISTLIGNINKELFEGEQVEDNIFKELPTQGVETEMVAINAEGHAVPISVSANTIPYQDQASRFFIFFRDITEAKQAKEKLHQMALYDHLTELPNRTMFRDLAERSVRTHLRTGEHLSILFVDIDRFKFINDQYGHKAGDLLLQEVSLRLTKCCRDSDAVGRWAGDEFVIMLTHQAHRRSSITVAEKIIDTLGDPILIGKSVLKSGCGCSIGIAQFPRDGTSAEELISRADQAMYQAKADGKKTFRFFTQEMNDRMMQRLQTESELNTALNEEQFELFFQPQISIPDNRFIGVEALIRWHHPDRGLVAPNDFIPIAEECGLIDPIGDWVMKTAINTVKKWHESTSTEFDMSFNLSPKQFRDKDLAKRLDELIKESGVPANNIVVEITEGHLIGETDTNFKLLESLKSLGVKIAIDDFGTGYSSLAYLRTLPVDIIKIDRSFIQDSAVDSASAHIVSAIIELAHALKLKVIAEGIEELSQLQLLRSEGCDEGQGYYIGRPLDLDKLYSWYSTFNPHNNLDKKLNSV